jgi:hypothetical protein
LVITAHGVVTENKGHKKGPSLRLFQSFSPSVNPPGALKKGLLLHRDRNAAQPQVELQTLRVWES